MTLDLQIRDMLDEAPELPEGSLGGKDKTVVVDYEWFFIPFLLTVFRCPIVGGFF